MSTNAEGSTERLYREVEIVDRSLLILTQLQAAAYCGNAENVRLLLEHGALFNTAPIGHYGNELQGTVSASIDRCLLLTSNEKRPFTQGMRKPYIFYWSTVPMSTRLVVTTHTPSLLPSVKGSAMPPRYSLNIARMSTSVAVKINGQ
jgi:hypothetical protein